MVTPNYHATSGYAVLQILTAAVKRAGSFDPEKLRDALASIAVYTVKGQYKANEQGLSMPVESLTFQIQNGERMIVWPEDKAEAKLLLMPKWEDRAKK
jgi:branched-chain amino acid transport system substrate-binding protein